MLINYYFKLLFQHNYYEEILLKHIIKIWAFSLFYVKKNIKI